MGFHLMIRRILRVHGLEAHATVVADAANVLDHPLIDRAEAVVGEAVHAGIAEAGLGRPAVPTLPDAGGAVFDGEAPRRERIVVDEPVGDVVAADLRQREHQVLGADEAGGEMAVARLDVFDEIRR